MPTTSTLKVTIYDGTRQLWHGPEVRISLMNPFTGTSNKKLVDKQMKKGENQIDLAGVPADAGQRYILSASAAKHRHHYLFPVKPIPNGTVSINIMLIADNPVPDFGSFSYKELQMRSPTFHAAISENIAEKDFFAVIKEDAQFGAVRLAALLNIEAKLRATPLKNGNAVDYIRTFKDVSSFERDRIKVDVAEDMPKNVRGLKTFTELNADLNEMNHKGFPISFKEKVAFSSLQLSFARKVENGKLAADIDIDLLTDIGHFGEVIRNKITRMKTDPFTVYGLLFDQGIRPLYTLKG